MSLVPNPADESPATRFAELAERELASLGIEKISLGELVMTSGRLIVGDPLPGMIGNPLARVVAPGTYPVSLFRHGDWNAFVVLRFSGRQIANWALATDESGSSDSVGNVGSGFASFMDAETQLLVEERDKGEQHSNPDYSDYLFGALFKDLPSEAGGVHLPDPGDKRNVVVFASGYGDGSYPAFWGLDTDGGVAAILCDLKVIPATSQAGG